MLKLHFTKKLVIYVLSGLLFNSVIFASDILTETGMIEKKIQELQLFLPTLSSPGGNYVPTVVVGKLVYISGQIPKENGQVKFVGKVGDNISEADAIKAAELCALNILAQLKAAGLLDKVKRCIKLTGYVNAMTNFTNHPKIINGASDLLVKLWRDQGKHARAAIGVSSLPSGVVVEIDAIFEIE
ncbi:MAG: RidA family protein [Janthinobacterium lividum]